MKKHIDKTILEPLRKALCKDFSNLYQKQFRADWKDQRCYRSIEINIMALDNTIKLITKKAGQGRLNEN